LERIWLTNNKLKALDGELFKRNLKLKAIYLAFNRINIIPSTIFDNLKVLNVLDLHGNDCTNYHSFNYFRKKISLDIQTCIKEFDEKFMLKNWEEFSKMQSTEIEELKAYASHLEHQLLFLEASNVNKSSTIEQFQFELSQAIQEIENRNFEIFHLNDNLGIIEETNFILIEENGNFKNQLDAQKVAYDKIIEFLSGNEVDLRGKIEEMERKMEALREENQRLKFGSFTPDPPNLIDESNESNKDFEYDVLENEYENSGDYYSEQ
jgi:chromosome segregation ATPase